MGVLAFHQGKTAKDDHEHDHEHGAEEHGDENPPELIFTPAQMQASGIEVSELQAQPLPTEISAPGEVRLNAYQSAHIGPRIQAQIIERYARLGEWVEAGAPLVSLSSIAVSAAQGNFLAADREWQRVRKLGKKTVSERRYVEARAERKQAESRLISYGLSAQQIAYLPKAKQPSDGRFQLLSPLAGRIISDDFVMGEIVDPGRVLFKVSNERELWVEVRLQAEQAHDVAVGAAARVNVGQHWLPARVISVRHTLDETTRTLGVRLSLANPDDHIHAGEFVSAKISVGGGKQPATVVPESAVLRSPDGDWQVFQYILRADDSQKYDAIALRSLNDWVVKLLLMPVDGVTEVLSYGGEVRQYQVNLDPQKLLAYELAVDDVVTAISDNNRNAGGWYLDRGAEQLMIRGVGWIRAGNKGLGDLANIPLKVEDGIAIRVADVAQVGFGGEIRQGAVTMTRRHSQGQQAGEPEVLGEVVAGIVLKRMGANTKATIDAVKARFPAIQQALPDGVTIEPFYDQGDLVEKAVETVSTALIEAFVLIVVVLLLFLLNLRATLLVLLSVPLSIGLALSLMSYQGLSANLMSLGGLAIAIGMMVDGSVVMMENIFKHLEKPDSHEGGISLRIQEASREVARPVFYAVIIIIVVFAPLFTLEGVEGKLFQPMAVSIVLAMMTSLLVALVVMPALASYLFRKPPL